jgi:RNA polymerase sigma-70 factor, ECF subfamily
MEELYRKYYYDLFHFILSMVCDREQAEDLVQEVYIRVLKSYHTFEKRSSEKTWIFTIAKNTVVDSYRKQKGWYGKLSLMAEWADLQIQNDSPLPEDLAIANEDIRNILSYLEHLKYPQQLVIYYRFIKDLSLFETAKALGWTEGKVKYTQHRTLKTLKQLLGDTEKRAYLWNQTG